MQHRQVTGAVWSLSYVLFFFFFFFLGCESNTEPSLSVNDLLGDFHTLPRNRQSACASWFTPELTLAGRWVNSSAKTGMGDLSALVLDQHKESPTVVVLLVATWKVNVYFCATAWRSKATSASVCCVASTNLSLGFLFSNSE